MIFFFSLKASVADDADFYNEDMIFFFSLKASYADDADFYDEDMIFFFILKNQCYLFISNYIFI